MNSLEAAYFTIKNFESEDFTDDPHDLGGATKCGITLRFLRRVKPNATVADIKALTLESAADVAHRVLMADVRIGEIEDWRLRLLVFDFSFHAGEDDGIPTLQKVINERPKFGPPLKVDGKLGDQTIGRCNLYLPYESQLLGGAYLAARQAFHIQRSYAPNQMKFLRGWLRRCTTLLRVVTLPPKK